MKDLVTIEHNDKMPLSKPQYKNAPPTQTQPHLSKAFHTLLP